MIDSQSARSADDDLKLATGFRSGGGLAGPCSSLVGSDGPELNCCWAAGWRQSMDWRGKTPRIWRQKDSA